jgi:hypothetical protein
MIRSRFATTAVLALFSPILLQGCDDTLSTAPAEPVALQTHRSPEVQRPHLAVCPSPTAEAASGTIGPDGGSLRVAGHTLTVPAGALSSPIEFTLRRPKGPHLKLEITADGSEHYRFAAPVAVTISYAGCQRQKSVQAWYIDTATGALLTRMRGDKQSGEAVTFSLAELPDDPILVVARGIYAVAY